MKHRTPSLPARGGGEGVDEAPTAFVPRRSGLEKRLSWNMKRELANHKRMNIDSLDAQRGIEPVRYGYSSTP